MSAESADIVVIGSGVAGTAVVTKLLMANPKASIIMLEAGGKLKMRDFGHFQNFMITGKLPQDSREIYDSTYDMTYMDRDRPGENVCEGDTTVPLYGSRMFAYGGSTGHWGGWSFRMKPEDFRLRSSLPDSVIQRYPHLIDWPIQYEDLEPYYGEAEHYIGVSGNSEDQTVPRSSRYPYPEFPYTLEDGEVIKALNAMEKPIAFSHLPIARHGFSEKLSHSHAPCQTTGLCKYCPFGARFVAANYLDDLKEHGDYPGFEIRQNAIVEKLLLGSATRVSGVEYLDGPRGKTKTILAGTVVIASGAIEGPKLMMVSKSEHYWRNGIGNDNDLVGRFLVTHPYYFFQAEVPSNLAMLQPQMGFPTLVSRHFDSIEEQARGKFIIVHPSSSPKVDISREMRAGRTSEEVMKKVTDKVRMQLQGIVEVFSRKENRVELPKNLDDRNRFGVRQSKITHNRPSDFDNRMLQIKDTLGEIFKKMGAGDIREENKVSWRADHAGCTTRMSESPADGVVDRDLKVHGVDNLYVCSNSSFSSLGAVNPTLTLTALSLRLGKHLSEKIYPFAQPPS